MNQERCILCGAECPQSLNILGHRVCPVCESRIMTVDATDSQYDDFLRRLRDISHDITGTK